MILGSSADVTAQRSRADTCFGKRLWRELATGASIRRQWRCMGNVIAEQASVTEPESLGQAITRGAYAQWVLVQIVNGRHYDTINKVAAEQRVVRALLIIDPAHRLVIVFTLRIPIDASAARIRCARQFANQSHRRFAE